MAIGPDGAIYVSDGYGNGRVVKLAPDGAFLLQWGHDVAVGRDGAAYTAEVRDGDRVQKFRRR